MQQQFTVIIERDPESDWLVGSVAELPGCYTQAPDMATLEANMREAIEAYEITFCSSILTLHQNTRSKRLRVRNQGKIENGLHEC